MRDWAREIIASGEKRAFPLMTCVGLQLTGLRVIDVVKDGKKQADCIRALASRYPSAAEITAMDLSVEAEAFGSSIRFTDNETPTVTGSMVTDAGAEALAVPPVGSGRTGVYLEAVALSAAVMTDRPVFGCLIGPFSLAGRLCGMTEALMNIHMNPGALRAVLGKCADFLTQYARAFRDTGADGIVIAEPAAGLISPAQCDDFSSSFVKRIIGEVQDERFMAVLHNCGSTRRHVASMASTGAMGLHFGNVVDMADVLPQVPAGVLVFGNLDPVRVLKDGTAAEVREAARELLRKTEGYGNFVLSSGCDVPHGTPLGNIDELFGALHDHNTGAR